MFRKLIAKDSVRLLQILLGLLIHSAPYFFIIKLLTKNHQLTINLM